MASAQYGRGDKKYPTIILEAVASYDLWIWHAFFRVAGANNDITVLHHSPLFDDLLADNENRWHHLIHGNHLEKGYLPLQMVFTSVGQRLSNHSLLHAMKKPLCLNGVQESARKMLKGHLVVQGRWRFICSTGACMDIRSGVKFYLPQQNILRTWVERCAIRQRKAKELRDKQTHSRLHGVIEQAWQL
ncbi:ALP1-like protein [Tanacetum coccineum]